MLVLSDLVINKDISILLKVINLLTSSIVTKKKIAAVSRMYEHSHAAADFQCGVKNHISHKSLEIKMNSTKIHSCFYWILK